MNRYNDIAEQYERVIVQMTELKQEYEGKPKGNIYIKRKMQLEEKGRAFIRKAKELGTIGSIVHIHGKRTRPSIKNPRLTVQENFNLYFVNVTEEEVSALVKLHVLNTVSYTIKFIRPGIIMTS